jgi:hypothetical protein
MSCAFSTASKCLRNFSFISCRASLEKTCMCRCAACDSRTAIRMIMFTGSLSTEPKSTGRLSLSTPIESAVTASVLQWGAANSREPPESSSQDSRRLRQIATQLVQSPIGLVQFCVVNTLLIMPLTGRQRLSAETLKAAPDGFMGNTTANSPRPGLLARQTY